MRVLSTLFLLLPLAAGAEEPDLTYVPLGFDVVPMVGTSGAMRGEDRRSVSIGLGGTLAGTVDGVALAPGFHIAAYDLSGVQLSGGFHVVRGDAAGMQGTGGFNIVGGDAAGATLAGGFNIVGGVAGGVVAAGGFDIVGDDAEGAVLAGGFALVGGDLRGVTAAGGVSVVGGEVAGAQLAPLGIAGGVRGAQLGVVNVAGDVQGVQVGVVNISENVDFALGLVNVVTDGRTHVDLWTGDTGSTTVALKHGGRYFHSLYFAEVWPFAPGTLWAAGLGLGGHAPVTDRVWIDVDLYTRSLFGGDRGYGGRELLSTGRVVAGVELAPGVGIYGGPTYSVLVSETGQAGQLTVFPVHQFDEEGAVGVAGWPGLVVGAQFF